jgi:hypothetical protein
LGNDFLDQITCDAFGTGAVASIAGHARHFREKPHHGRRLRAEIQVGDRLHVRCVVGWNRAAFVDARQLAIGEGAQAIDDARIFSTALI